MAAISPSVCLGSSCGMQASRRKILKCEDDPAEMHRLLTNLPPLGSLTADELAQQAVSIYRRCPPKSLLQRTHLHNRTCVTFHFLSVWAVLFTCAFLDTYFPEF